MSPELAGAIVVSLGLPAIVAGIVPHGTTEEIAVFGWSADQRMIPGERRCRLWRRSNLRDRLFEQPLDGRTRVLVTVDAVADGVRAGLLDQRCRILPARPDNAHIPRCPGRPSVSNTCWHSTPGLRPDASALASSTAVCRDGNSRSQQRMGLAITDLDRGGVDPHHDLTADGWPRGVIAAINTHGGIVADGPNDLGEDAEGSHWQRPQVWLRLLEHRLDLTTRAAVDADGGPILLPVPQELVLGFQCLGAPSGQRGALAMLNRTLDASFPIGIGHPCGIGDHGVISQLAL